MRNYNLYIAGYNIRFESSDDGPELVPSKRFYSYLNYEKNSDILIRVHSGKFILPHGVKKVFDAPYFEEINSTPLKKSNQFWSVYRYRDDLFINTIFPHSPDMKEATLQYSLTGRGWDLWFYGSGAETDPMEYPLDGLILYYLTVMNNNIMIHASGINYSGRGYLFSGVSGKGKTTLAKLWKISGANIIHDDRLILRKAGSGYKMYNTPVYNDDESNESELDKIFIIEHGTRNEIIPVRGAECVSMIMANCIQHNWDPEIITRLLGSVSALSTSIPVAKLRFRPERSVIDYILENEQRKS